MARKRKAARTKNDAPPDDAGQDVHDFEDEDKPSNHDDVGFETPQDIKVEHFTIPSNSKPIPCERRGGKGQPPSLIFTHGAGGGLTAPAASQFADGFATISPIVSFQGSMNLPSRTKIFRAVMESENFDTALGGRSMGARAAAIAATKQDHRTKALVLVSFPLVGGKKGESREQILLDLGEGVHVLFISGDRDGMCDLGRLEEVMGRMEAKCWLVTVEGADHGMNWKPKGSVEDMRRRTGVIAAEWLKGRDAGKRRCSLRWDEEEGWMQYTDWVASEDKKAQTTEDDAKPPAKKRKRGKT